MALQPRKRWHVQPPASPQDLAPLSHLPALLAQLLYGRGIRTAAEAETFLERRWEGPSPFELKGMGKAVARIRQAIRQGERIAVYGDFDADGVTATAVLVETLEDLGADVKAHIPHRVEEGYGLNKKTLASLRQRGFSLVVSVDCGIRSADEVAFAQKRGLDVVVTDHHTVGDVLPPACAVVNPKQPGCRYPFKGLTGVGVAYKLAQALLLAEEQVPLRRGSREERSRLDHLLDLVAIGTVADIAPLVGENRFLVSRGLERLNEPRRSGLRALIEGAGLQPGHITSTHIGFILAPRLNAAGRIAAASLGYDLLTTSEDDNARARAKQLEELNRERQQLTRDAFQKARRLLEESRADGRPLLMVKSEDFNPGIVGLVASRLTEEYYRPSVVVELGEEFSKGSARSIPEFHITEALDRCADLLVRHGGHAAAAGFTCTNDNLPALEEKLLAIAEEALDGLELVPAQEVDVEIPLREASGATLELLDRLEPFGEGNPTPCLLSRDVEVLEARAVGYAGQHLWLLFSDGQAVWDGIAFHRGAWASQVPGRVDVVYHLEKRQWEGQDRLQLNVQDLRPAAQGPA